jgi:CRISPR-associated endonuclease/helicase Cas3
MSLQLGDFPAFHRAVHGYAPFAWQERLLAKVVQGGWPACIDLPTGAGKTTCIDIALFAFAMGEAGTAPRQPRRIAMVVDRRIVVDQVFERGKKLLDAVESSADPVVQRVAAALRAGWGGDAAEAPLGVYALRGGIPKDDGWARDPARPLILSSTVDQLGSRLLLQGYGVSLGMRPVHAGLVGNDTLLLLDEVHLSQPFAETLQQIRSLRQRAASDDGRFVVSFLSATPGLNVEGERFGLVADESDENTVIGRRIRAAKKARLEEVADRAELVTRIAVAVARMVEHHIAVGVVVNRVASARDVARALRLALAGKADVELITGRMRPLDRDDAIARLRPRVEAGWRDRGGERRPIVVVGTQSIEAGADFDFDALVTECASLDALRQRFGRVDRVGAYGMAEGLVLMVKDADKEDPVYGEALQATWKWLKDKGGAKKVVDFGIHHLALPAGEELAALVAPKPQAPVLLPAYLDLWMQTSPRPMVVPEVGLWLHGPQRQPADVQVLWRCDLLEEHLDDPSTAAQVVGAIRPSSLEAMPIPIGAARQWLRGEAEPDMADAVSLASNDESRSEGSVQRRVLRWAGEESEVIDADALRPGDTIVVPATRGGIGDGSFCPASFDVVQDRAEQACLFSRGVPMLRLHPEVLRFHGIALDADRGDDIDVEASDLANAAVEAAGWRRIWLAALGRRGPRFPVQAGDAIWSVIQGRRLPPAEVLRLRKAADASIEDGAEWTTDSEDSYHTGWAVSLAEHSGDVERFARRFADRIGLPSSLADDVALAGWLHDIGKSDPRFQALLHGGDAIAALRGGALLAKSAMSPEAKSLQRSAAERSGYPQGMRHEVASLALLQGAESKVRPMAKDFDLVLHLVASHHGYCRPFAPGVEDAQPVDLGLVHAGGDRPPLHFGPISSANTLHHLDSPLADRFWALVERHGWWGLCWLESILRLADHRASEAAQEVGR